MKDFLRNNGILILIIALLLSLITAVLSFTFGGIANPFSNLAGVAATPFRNGLNTLVRWTEGVYSDAFEREQMEEELEALKLENAQLREKAREGEAASRENERLRNLLGLREKRRDLALESATVTARSASNWESTLTISKGSNYGLVKNQCVIDPYGNLVGVVDEVGVNWATVLTVTDTDIDMGGKVSRPGGQIAAVLEGDFSLMTQGRLKLSYLPEDTQLSAGDLVLTSGRGGVYPPDLVVGTVESVHSDASNMTRYAVVAPKADLNSLHQVFVIKSFDIVE